MVIPRSASTSLLDTASPTPHFETGSFAPVPVSTGTPRAQQRAPSDPSLLAESNSPLMSPTSTRYPSNNLPKAEGPPSFSTATATTGASNRGQQQQQQQYQQTPSNCWWYPRKNSSLPDFVLISEFSEVEGPRAVMTIPDNIVDLTRDSYSSHKQRSQESSDTSNTTLGPTNSSNVQAQEETFDIHEFVLRITSVDQQVREMSEGFRIPDDIEVHICDTEKGYWAYVHHFTLFDINARGFVRPFCMSYITRDPYKIMGHYEDMRHKFSKAALYFKTGNFTLFRQDLTRKLRDLNYTNNLLSDAPTDSTQFPDISTASIQGGSSLPSESSQNTLTQLTVEAEDFPEEPKAAPVAEGLNEQQKADLESIKEAIESATLIISVLEHYSVDGQPLLGHADDGNEGPTSMAPLSDLSPMTSSENLAMLAAGRSGTNDSSLFLGATSRPGSRIRHKLSTPNVLGGTPSRILDAAITGASGAMMPDGLTAPLPHLLGLQYEQSRKNSVVSEYDSIMYETPEYEAQYVTTLYPLFRDEVVFRPLRELCVATMVWNSSIQFHLGIKKIKDILKDFQSDTQMLGEATDNAKRMHPTSASLTIGPRFMLNFRNPDFNRVTVRQAQHQEAPVPLMELLEGISLANVPSDDGITNQEVLLPGTQETAANLGEAATTERKSGPNLYMGDADDEQTGYDSLDDEASFFTAATGMATQTDTPTRETFVVTPLERSARVAEWHQQQQTLHHSNPPDDSTEQVPFAFGAGVNHGESSLTTGTINRKQHRNSAQSGTSIGVGGPSGPTGPGPGSIYAASYPTIVLETLQKDPTLAKHLVYALLSGQKVCIMGQTESESKVRVLVAVLATFLPHTGYPTREEQLIEHQRQIVLWHQGYGMLQVADMDKYCLVGVDSSKIDPKFLEADICILDYDTLTWVNGRQYTDGILLESIFRNMSVFSEDTSFLAFVDSKLFEVLLKAFLYYYLVFHGRLYQGGLLLHLGAQSFYSSGVSDDGEAFSYQSNFHSTRESSVTLGRSGFSRGGRSTSAYPSSIYVGTNHRRNSTIRSASLSSHESSDAEKPLTGPRATRMESRRRHTDDVHYDQNSLRNKYRGRQGISGDESSHIGGQMQFTTSQGMRKWKKWFEYWSAKSAAMIDPALAAFVRSDSIAAIDGAAGDGGGDGGGDGTRRKRNGSRRSSPHRRSRHLPGHHRHASPGRSREAKERDRMRDRKSTLDHFDDFKMKPAISSSSDSESHRNEKDGARSLHNEAGDNDPDAESRIDETHATSSEALSPKFGSNKGSSALRRLKPKRALTLHRSHPRTSDQEHDQPDGGGGTTANGVQLSRAPSSGSAASPPPSATFRSLAGAIRAMSFSPSSTSANTNTSAQRPSVSGAASHLDSSAKSRSGRMSLDGQYSRGSSRDFSDTNLRNSKDVKRRGSTRAKAKAWFKAQKKRRSRVYEDDYIGNEEIDVNENEHAPDYEPEHEDEQEPLTKDHQNQNVDQMEGQYAEQQSSPMSDPESTKPIRPPLKSAPASTMSLARGSLVTPLLPVESRSVEDLTEAMRALATMEPQGSPEPSPAMQPSTTSSLQPLEVPLTLEEIAAQEPTKLSSSRAPPPTISAATIHSHYNLSSGDSSHVSSANGSRITSPTFTTSFTGSAKHHQLQRHRQQRQQQKQEQRVESYSKGTGLTSGLMSAVTTAVTVGETRSDFDDSEADRRWDLDKESATEYETSMETFAGADGNGSPEGSRSTSVSANRSRQSLDSIGRPSLGAVSIKSAIVAPSAGTAAIDEATVVSEHGVVHETTTTKESEIQQTTAGNDSDIKDTVALTEEEEVAVREMLGGVTGADDWAIIVHLATMVDEHERSKRSEDADAE
ncbi:Guanine nucleotide exchange protein smcr8 [Mortierella polycephala]|uniref:Guanine nucleotide exchange protein smcr8 n=1 Tax=Mortierella polycephala TaxID=41804 RepID=A0A9P6Q7F9_9FUNG|nr:Guanine nucleotide exchange protein smcr8 [Mortierella polycephala]